MGEQRDRMLRGDLYDGSDPELVADHARCRRLMADFNGSDVGDRALRRSVLEELLGHVGEGVELRPPIYLDYGYPTTIGARTFANFGLVILDPAPVTIGSDTQIGPNVQLLTATHPLDAATRRAGLEAAEPIVIGDGVWLGGGVIVCPGVTIGADTVVGAGAVVAGDLPAGVLAVGNPARPIRDL
jgi:maltose O-acetyltransferase